ncbi:hypothetical protein NDU88_002463 [Pleurodeles waltl]|uniref:Uncharacterized protein n=1 Tax=Pleurodeles waltl TaxID=8319 RepID=A0AAV7U9S5_PLEWA|nr:hypothetical protein NDU88_002463 [Pleurodeles waltl]
MSMAHLRHLTLLNPFRDPLQKTRETSPSASSHASDSDLTQDEPKPAGKRKRKLRNLQDDVLIQRTVASDPENIIHPCSTEWIPCAVVVHYVQDRLRKGFDSDVRNTLQSALFFWEPLYAIFDSPRERAGVLRRKSTHLDPQTEQAVKQPFNKSLKRH